MCLLLKTIIVFCLIINNLIILFNNKYNLKVDEDSLKSGNSEDRRIIVNKLVNSGINITPSMLNLIINLDKPLEKIPLIVKELSFLPSFNGHLSKDDIVKISNGELLNALKRVMIKENQALIERNSSNGLKVKDINIKTPNKDDLKLLNHY